MEMTAAAWWSAIGQTALVIVISFIVLCVVTSLVRFQLLAEAARENQELGLGEEKGFRLLVMNQIAAARKAREPISVVMLKIPEGDAPPADVEAKLKTGLRATDTVMSCGNNLIGLLLLCGSDKVETVVRRVISDEVAGALSGVNGWRFGVAGYPEHGFKTSDLYNRAMAMLATAEKENILIAGMAKPEEVADEKSSNAGLLDELTGVVREDKMIGTMRRYIGQSRREDKPASLVYLDIDQSDRVSAQLGAETFTALVKELAAFLDAQFREKDLLCRFGPAGFVVGMAITPADAMQVAQRVMAAVRKNVFKAGNATKITLGAGLAGHPDVQGTAVQYFVAAEAALQQAKARGRNQAVRYEANMPMAPTPAEAVDRL